uniref:Uncharacterized protein n=1 Tax=Anopheles culicifacies TaxID=139723 RepID=A0A182LZP8_9DIPT
MKSVPFSVLLHIGIIAPLAITAFYVNGTCVVHDAIAFKTSRACTSVNSVWFFYLWLSTKQLHDRKAKIATFFQQQSKSSERLQRSPTTYEDIIDKGTVCLSNHEKN